MINNFKLDTYQTINQTKNFRNKKQILLVSLGCEFRSKPYADDINSMNKLTSYSTSSAIKKHMHKQVLELNGSRLAIDHGNMSLSSDRNFVAKYKFAR